MKTPRWLLIALFIALAFSASAGAEYVHRAVLAQTSSLAHVILAPTTIPSAAYAPVPTARLGSASGNLAAQVVSQVNAERAKYGLSGLRVDAELMRAAQVRAREIVRKFSHTRPDGTAWFTVSASAYGENIAVGQKTADKVMAAWLTSQGHRENILRPSYGSIGVCAYIFGGVTYWVQLFGK